MNFPTLLFLLLFSCSLTAQPTSYERADAFAESFKGSYKTAEDLALQLTKPFNTDWEKARVLFSWIAFNIRYDHKKMENTPARVRYSGNTREEVEEERREDLEDAIRQTLRKKKGICQDYSRLYERMGRAVGLEVEFIGGLSRNLGGSERHAWNAVKLGGAWRLLDATWAAGYYDDDRNRFVERFSPGFFNTPPHLFVLNHLPREERWQLLEKPLSKEEFGKQAMVHYGSADYRLTAFTPEDGKIKKVDGKAEVRFRFEGPAPKLIIVTTGKRELPAQVQKLDDGWVALTFKPMGGSVVLYAGDSRTKMGWLARFK
jgi:hypothetical protein